MRTKYCDFLLETKSWGIFVLFIKFRDVVRYVTAMFLTLRFVCIFIVAVFCNVFAEIVLPNS